MPEEIEDEEEVELPTWYLQIEKGAGKLSMGCFVAEVILVTTAKYVIPKDTIDIIQIIIVPFGIICIIVSGYHALDTLNKVLDTVKKLKK